MGIKLESVMALYVNRSPMGKSMADDNHIPCQAGKTISLANFSPERERI